MPPMSVFVLAIGLVVMASLAVLFVWQRGQARGKSQKNVSNITATSTAQVRPLFVKKVPQTHSNYMDGSGGGLDLCTLSIFVSSMSGDGVLNQNVQGSIEGGSALHLSKLHCYSQAC